MSAPLLTVCVCTHDRPDDLRRCLDGLRAQRVRADVLDLLVIDSASAPEAAVAARAVAAAAGARLARVEAAGLSLARNAGAQAAQAAWIAYLDDDAVPAPDWAEQALAALAGPAPPALLGGRVLPVWEAPLPPWWPARLRGVLSIVEAEGAGAFGSPALPPGLEPCGANLLVHVPSLRATGGFCAAIGRQGTRLLSDEEVHLAWRLRARGQAACYDSRLVVYHRIPAERLTPAWLLRRLHWQGVSAVRTRRLLDAGGSVWRELPRRLAVAVLCAPAALLPRANTRLLGARWRFAYASGFLRAALARPGARAIAAAAAGGGVHGGVASGCVAPGGVVPGGAAPGTALPQA